MLLRACRSTSGARVGARTELRLIECAPRGLDPDKTAEVGYSVRGAAVVSHLFSLRCGLCRCMGVGAVAPSENEQE